MSIKFMAKVYELAVDSDTREILMALADHADHEGYSIFPSVALLAWKIGDGSMNEQGEYKNTRTVQRRLRELQDIGALVELKPSGFHRATEYGLDLSVFPKKAAFKPLGDRLSPIKAESKGDKLSSKGDKKEVKGDTTLSPEPSLNVSETKNNKTLGSMDSLQAGCWQELATLLVTYSPITIDNFCDIWARHPDIRRHRFALDQTRIYANPVSFRYYETTFLRYDPDKVKPTHSKQARPAAPANGKSWDEMVIYD
jgi:hypothetical protein